MEDTQNNNGAFDCPLCKSYSKNYHTIERMGKNIEKKLYLKCQNCSLIFLYPKYFLNKKTEKSRYDLHQNHPHDPAYRNFLSQLSQPMIELLDAKDKGLDFGCGPGPTLSLMFEESGFNMLIYDPFYYKNDDVLKCKYNFITASEVVEHFHYPAKEFQLMWNLLEPNGLLGIMTKFMTKDIDFPTWHYKNDDTHVCFYSKETFQFIAKTYNAKIVYQKENVIIFQRIIS